MAFDYKKEYKEFYMPKGTPSIVRVPKMNYIAVRGSGKKKCLSPAKKYKLYKSSINKSIHFVQRSLSSSTRG